MTDLRPKQMNSTEQTLSDDGNETAIETSSTQPTASYLAIGVADKRATNINSSSGANWLEIEDDEDDEVFGDKTKHHDFVFDSASSHFYIIIFLKQFVLHVFYPFFLFLSPSFSHQQFSHIGFDILFFFNTVLPVIVLVMIATYASIPSDEFEFLQGSLWFPLLFLAFHRITIAVKYASMTPSEYKRYLTTTNENLLASYKSQLELLSGWGQRPVDAVVDFEVVVASIRSDAEIDSLFFTLPNPNEGERAQSLMLCWKAFLLRKSFADFDEPCNDIIVEPSGIIKIPAFAVCKAIQNYACNQVDLSLIHSICGVSFAVLIILMPYLAFISSKEINSPASIVFLITSSIISWFFVNLTFSFIFVAIYDMARMSVVGNFLNNIIRISDLSNESIFATGGNSSKLIGNRTNLTRDYISQVRKRFSRSTNVAGDHFINHNNHHDRRGTSDFVNDGQHVEMIVDNEEDVILPRLSYRYIGNFMAWTHIRLLMKHIGARYRHRLDIFVISCLLAMVVLSAAALGLVFQATGVERIKVFNTVLFRQVIITDTSMIVFLIILTYLAANVNFTFNLHRATLAQHIARVRNQIIVLQRHIPNENCDQQEGLRKLKRLLERYHQDEKALQVCLETVRNHNDFDPLYIFGILEASYSLPASIISAAMSFYATLLSAYATAGVVSSS